MVPDTKHQTSWQSRHIERQQSGAIGRRQLLKVTGSIGAVGFLSGCLGGGDSGSNTTTNPPTTTFKPECSAPTALSQSDVETGGTVSKGCYEAESGLAVKSGTLTLEAGVWIQFPKNKGLDIKSDGALRSKGTGGTPVVLTGTKESPGHWTGVRFEGSESQDNVLEHTTIEYAGGDTWSGDQSRAGLYMEGGSVVSLDGVTLRGNNRAGLVTYGASNQLSLSNSQFLANEMPAWVNAKLASEFTSDNSFGNNDNSVVKLGVKGARDSITSKRTWEDPGIPFHVTRTITLHAPVTVKEGATFRFEQEAGLSVNNRSGSGTGQLRVEASSSRRAVFTGVNEARGKWKGISFGSANSKTTDHLLRHATVEFAGGSPWHGGDHSQAGIYVRGPHVSLRIENSTIQHNARSGLTMDDGRSELSVGNSAITHFRENAVPMRLEANVLGGVGTMAAFTNNDEEYVYVNTHENGSKTTVMDDTTWVNLDVPYRMTGQVVVNAILGIEQGTTLEFEENYGLRIDENAQLEADASGGNEITFTGVEKRQGFWQGIGFINSSSSDNVMKNVVIEYGGSEQWHGGDNSAANLFLRGPSEALIRNSTVRGSGHHGISIEKKSQLRGCNGMTFENNKTTDTYDDYTTASISKCS